MAAGLEQLRPEPAARGEVSRMRERAIPSHIKARGRVIQLGETVLLELAIEGRSADAELPRHLRAVAAGS